MIVEEIIHCGRRYAYIHYSATWDVYFLKWELRRRYRGGPRHTTINLYRRAFNRVDYWNSK